MLIFAFGTLWFWLLVTLTVILITAFVEKEEQTGTGATITFLISLSLMCFFGNLESFKNILNYIVDNPWTILGLFALYVLFGVAWSFFKWYFYLSELKEKFKNGTDYSYNKRKIDITDSDNKLKVLVWMCYWPFSAIWTLINDPIKKMYEYILRQLSGLYQKMSNRMFKDFEDKEKAEFEKLIQEREIRKNNK